MTLLEKILAFNRKEKLFQPGDRLLLTVSGGLDSMVMMDIFSRLSNEAAVAHCNFRLRGEESDADEKWVRQKAGEYGLPIFVQGFDTAEYARRKHISIQMAARELRYEYFARLASQQGYTKILTAHHRTDNMETFFIHLLRSSGTKGLQGIPARRGNIIRPLLGVSRQEIAAYARERNISFREDSSNRKTYYLRNRIRHRLLPALAGVEPDYASRVEKSMQLLGLAGAFVEDAMQALIRKYEERSGEQILFPLEVLRKHPHNELLLYYWLHPYGFAGDILSQIVQSMRSGNSGRIFAAKQYRLNVDRKYLILYPHSPVAEKNYLIRKPEGRFEDGLSIVWRSFPKEEGYSFSTDPMTADFDRDSLVFPLEIRHWKAGDRFRPLGMRGSKLVSDLLTDRRVSLADKAKVRVLTSGGEIVWVLGYRLAEPYKVKKETKNILQIQIIDGL